jgi:hypothetical protein
LGPLASGFISQNSHGGIPRIALEAVPELEEPGRRVSPYVLYSFFTDNIKKPMVPSELSELWCGIHTDPILRCSVSLEGLNWEDLLEGVAPELGELANGLRVSTKVPSQDLSGV